MLGRRAFGRGVFGVLAGGVTAALSGCGVFGGNSYRFKMTVEVDTPQGLKTGSAVYEVSAANRIDIGSETGKREWVVRGEALVVDLPNGPVFALLKTEDRIIQDFAEMSMVTLDPDYKYDIVESAGRLARGGSRKGEVKREYWPLMVRFGNVNDPKTVTKVDPEVIGVRRIVLETTRDDVTTGIEKTLRWLNTIDGGLTSRLAASDPTNPPFSATTTIRDFSSEIKYDQ